MNAPNPLTAERRSAERKGYEPSMEEILASIRRIIADDQAFTQRAEQAPFPVREPRPEPRQEPRPEPRSLAEPEARQEEPVRSPPPEDRFARQAKPAAEAPRFPVEAKFEAKFQPFKPAGAPPAPVQRPVPPEPARPPVPQFGGREERSDRPLISPQTDAAVSSAFNALLASQRLPSEEDLKQTVSEMLRPMLQAWLDDNLPVLVERLVRAEIERVARGGR